MSLVESLLNNQPNYASNTPLLPIMHSCECFDARGILNSRVLEARLCKVFNEKLVYFYYGKPSYPVGEKVLDHRTDTEYYPVCFVVDPKRIPIYKVYPFDSGAFKQNIYGDFLHRNMDINEFEIPNNTHAIQAYVSYMFGTNDNYLDGSAIYRGHTGNPYIDSLINMNTAKGTMKFDERARTIEVISNSDIKIGSAVKCVILPKNLLQDNNIVNFLKENNIDIIDYRTRQLVHPTKYYSQIFELAINYIETHWEEI